MRESHDIACGAAGRLSYSEKTPGKTGSGRSNVVSGESGDGVGSNHGDREEVSGEDTCVAGSVSCEGCVECSVGDRGNLGTICCHSWWAIVFALNWASDGGFYLEKDSCSCEARPCSPGWTLSCDGDASSAS